jgi:polyketide biosynthesis 3-hydroxy-3-methylglutaryl-CoA synthase-like enzyme PksG
MRQAAGLRPVGIEAAAGYCGAAAIGADVIFEGRGLSTARIGNLMMSRKSVALPCEDIVSFSANAASALVCALAPRERSTIRTLIVATESGVDFAKAASTYVHDLLDLPRACRLFEVKQACYAGVAALRAASALVAAEGGRALVIAGDLPTPVRGTYAEPSQGAGAVALLVGEPRVARIRMDAAGCHGYETTDFSRPRADLDLVDVDMSLMSYIECLIHAFGDYALQAGGAHFVTSFDALAMHTPFPGMVKGAHRTMIRRGGWLGPAEIEADFAKRLEPSLRYPSAVGNIYSGSTLLALLSAIAHGADGQDTIGVFSYGGGCASEFFSCVTGSSGREIVKNAGIDRALDERAELSLDEYDELVDATATTGFGIRDAAPDPSRYQAVLAKASTRRPLAVLSSIKGFHREYSWVQGGLPCTAEQNA